MTVPMTNTIIQSLWIGNQLSKIEELCINSFLKNGHTFHLYSYQEIKNVPLGTVVFDANIIIPYKDVFLDSHETWAAFSDWFRYKLLYKKGGWWSDLDVICVKYLDMNTEYRFSTERYFVGGETRLLVTTSLIKSPSKADFLLELLEYIESKDFLNVEWASFGPNLFDSVIREYESENFIEPPITFCPINWNEIELFFINNRPDFSEKTYTIHLWNEMWRRAKIDKNKSFHQNSVIEFYKKKYLV